MKDDARRLADIIACADEIAEYLQDRALDEFQSDRMRQRAIERLLTIIGEAAKHLNDDTRGAIAQPWREIIRFRDKGIHAYDALSAESLYRIATESVPELRDAVKAHVAGRAD